MIFKKKFFTIYCLLSLIILSNCVQSTAALFGPAITGAKTGNIYHSGLSYASSNIIKQQFGQSPTEYVKNKLTIIKNKDKASLVTNKKNHFKSKQLSLNLKNNDIQYNNFVNAVKKTLK